MPSLTDAADPVTRPPAESSSDPIPELIQLGARLGQARRDRGLSCADLADRLRLGPDQLDALERGDRSGLREPVFVIALAKRVAGALGVDVEEEIAALRRSRLMADTPPTRPLALAAEQSQSRPAGAPSAGDGFSGSRALPGRSLLLALGLVVLAAVLGVGGLLWSRARRPQAEPSVSLSQPRPQPEGSSLRPDTGETGKEAAAKETQPAAAPGILLVQASEPSWLEVRDAAGTTLFRGTLEGERRFPLGEGLRLLAGRPDQVRVSVGDQPPRVLGTIDDVGWKTFPSSRQEPQAP